MKPAANWAAVTSTYSGCEQCRSALQCRKWKEAMGGVGNPAARLSSRRRQYLAMQERSGAASARRVLARSVQTALKQFRRFSETVGRVLRKSRSTSPKELPTAPKGLFDRSARVSSLPEGTAISIRGAGHLQECRSSPEDLRSANSWRAVRILTKRRSPTPAETVANFSGEEQ